MNALSQPGMAPSACSHASHFFPTEENGWPCPVCPGQQNWQGSNSAGAPASSETETIGYQRTEKVRQTRGERELKQRQLEKLREHQGRVAARQSEAEKLREMFAGPRGNADPAVGVKKWQEQLLHDRDATSLPALPSPISTSTLTERRRDVFAVTASAPDTAKQIRRAPEQVTRDMIFLSSGSPDPLSDIPITPLLSAEESRAGVTGWPAFDELYTAPLPGKDYGFPIMVDSDKRGHGERLNDGKALAAGI